MPRTCATVTPTPGADGAPISRWGDARRAGGIGKVTTIHRLRASQPLASRYYCAEPAIHAEPAIQLCRRTESGRGRNVRHQDRPPDGDRDMAIEFRTDDLFALGFRALAYGVNC